MLFLKYNRNFELTFDGLIFMISSHLKWRVKSLLIKIFLKKIIILNKDLFFQKKTYSE
jgi:hypothetical protein